MNDILEGLKEARRRVMNKKEDIYEALSKVYKTGDHYKRMSDFVGWEARHRLIEEAQLEIDLKLLDRAIDKAEHSSERYHWELPDISQFSSTEEEAEWARKCTAIKKTDNGLWRPLLVVGARSWGVAYADSKAEAEWFCWQLSKALIKVARGDVPDSGVRGE